MSDVVIIAALIVWWSFAVVLWVHLVFGAWINGKKDLAISIGMVAVWPLIAVIAIPVIAYEAVVASTARIKVDLKNRSLMREFEQWLHEKQRGKISPKNDTEGEA